MKSFPYLKILLAFVCISFFSFTGNVDDLLLKGENARQAFKDMDAIGYYKQILELDSNNFQALWKTSFVYQRIGWLEKNSERKKQFFADAIRYANKLYAKYPGTYEANIVLAGSLARMSEFLSAKEKVHTARDIQRYGEMAMGLNPQDHQVWYLLGWLNFELAKANWMERSLAGVLFGGLPKDMTIEKGIRYLEKAIELHPDYIVYIYDLATFYEQTNTATAIQLTRKALAINPVAPEDFIYLEKCRNLLTRLNS
jgi:tetratricopeptide (TPR) repeat protein